MSETELVERLERLERAHRRLKGFALAALGLATALATIYATQPVPQKIAAHEFDVVDDSGKLRVMLGVKEGVSVLSLYDAQAKTRAAIAVTPDGMAYIGLLDAEGKARASLNVTLEGKPHIELSDPQGFEMDLGSTNTVEPKTGATERTTAASIVMFGNDKEKHVIWQAP